MRYLSDEELAKYFDDGTQEQRPDAATGDQGGWSLDDAFANPKAGGSLDSGDAANRPVEPVATLDHAARRESRASLLPPLTDDLTWTGRDTQPAGSGSASKMPIIFIGALIACALVVMMAGGGSEPTSALPQIGR